MSKRVVASVLAFIMVMSSVSSLVMADETVESSESVETVETVETVEAEETEASVETEESVVAEEPVEEEAAEPEESVEESTVETEITEISEENEEIEVEAQTFDSGVNDSIYYKDLDGRVHFPASEDLIDIRNVSGDQLVPGKYYYVQGDVTINSRLVAKQNGATNIILCDGAVLHANKGIGVIDNGNSGYGELVIWGQAQGTGKLIAKAPGDFAGIGGGFDSKNTDCGKVTVNGGHVQAYGADCGAGIGGANEHDGGVVVINGGKVEAYGGGEMYVFVPFGWADWAAAGIGGGDHGDGGEVRIYGGEVTASGYGVPNAPAIAVAAAGIGGGDSGRGGNVFIYGGKVNARGGYKGAQCIGHGNDNGTSGEIHIEPNMCVKYEDSNDNLLYASANERVDKCRSKYQAVIEACTHIGETMNTDSIEGHSFTCNHCLTPGHNGEVHAHDYMDGTCVDCGFEAAIPGESADAAIKGYSLMLGNDIGVKYYVKMNSVVSSDPDTYVKFIYPDYSDKSVSISEATYDSATDCYIFELRIPAKQMSSLFYANVHYKDTILCSSTFSVRDYADYIYRTTTDADQKALVVAMLNYGAAAQKFFKYNCLRESSLANYYLSDEDKVVPELDASTLNYLKISYSTVRTKNNTPVLANMSLALESETQMRLYFEDNGGYPSFCYNGEMLTVTKNQGYNMITIDSLASQLLRMRPIYINGEKNCDMISISPAYYIYLIQTDKTASSDLKALTKALYWYAECSNLYTY